MFELSQKEKTNLKTIADTGNKSVSRRAMIVLMSEAGQNPENISAEVDLTVRVVKRWQRAFLQKRMNIFPNTVLSQINADDDSQSVKTTPSSETIKQIAEAEPTESNVIVVEKVEQAEQVDTSATEASPTAANGVEKSIDQPQSPQDSENLSSLKKAKKTKRKKSKKSARLIRVEIGLESTDTMAEAGRKVLRFHFERMLKHEPGTRRGEDIEELHQMRVATRRMRAAFRVFGDVYTPKVIKPLLAGLKETGRALGPVRDLDVFMEKLQHYQEALTAKESKNLKPLISHLEAQRDKARQKMTTHLDGRSYAKFKKNFSKFVQAEGLGAKPITLGDNPEPHQVRHVGPTLIYDTYGKVRAYETVLADAPIDTLHQLRIASKRLRYTLECLEEVLGPEARKVIEEVKIIQDHLGDLNDAEVASRLIQKFLKEFKAQQQLRPVDERQSWKQIKTYRQAKKKELEELLVSFPAVWANFNRPKLRNMLAKAVANL